MQRTSKRKAEKKRAMHSPGPWQYGTKKKMGSVGDKARIVDDKGFWFGSDEQGLDIGEVYVTASQDTAVQEANARLVIAAPDLLAACKEWATIWHPGKKHEASWLRLVAAIAKAESGD